MIISDLAHLSPVTSTASVSGGLSAGAFGSAWSRAVAFGQNGATFGATLTTTFAVVIRA